MTLSYATSSDFTTRQTLTPPQTHAERFQRRRPHTVQSCRLQHLTLCSVPTYARSTPVRTAVTLDPIALRANVKLIEVATSSSVKRLQTITRIGRQKQIHKRETKHNAPDTRTERSHTRAVNVRQRRVQPRCRPQLAKQPTYRSALKPTTTPYSSCSYDKTLRSSEMRRALW